MNPLQLVLVFFQLAQQKAKAYTDNVTLNAESTENKVTSLTGWQTGEKPDAYPSADAVATALNNKTAVISVSGRTFSIKNKEV
jgi:hypothetical protein